MYIIRVLCLLFGITTVISAATTATPKEQLHQLELRIQKLQQQMYNTRTKYGRLQQQLQDSEEDIGEVAQRLEILHGALTDKQHSLTDLQNQQTVLQAKLVTQRSKLAQQIRSSYIVGHQNYLKLWLNQESPFIIGRLLTYYDYFNQARIAQIKEINSTLQSLTNIKQTINSETGDLNHLVTNQRDKKTELEGNYQERHKILSKLAKRLETQDQELTRLQNDKYQLQSLLGTLEEGFKSIPQPIGWYNSFAKLKGQLPRPLKGKIIKNFGQRSVGYLKWQGILIKATKGSKIRAVAWGRVVFAQWFRNLGLLVIVDHGNGYMSLYAHNQSLYIKLGDWVKTGDIIATVGNSGGRKTPALYFEIRHQGIPQPPRQWLR
ncbi:peptidoglycan DD-metalloendopeptidase family protein [Candidatus Halobeggiatoa sp. HSG11]|nr:peptidoglycan DD-metalloendopeptidase family protein [Candidatus Halobeggiatoa sp. HSG11]